MAARPDRTRPDKPQDDKRQRDEKPSGDRRWDRKQGTPKDPGMAKTVERASSRYSASEQSERKRGSGR
jgi:hypothetical protein